MRLLMYVTAMLFSVTVSIEPANAGDNTWRVRTKETQVVLRHQESFGQRLSRPLKARVCLERETRFVASFQGNEFSASCNFIHETMRHLKEVLEHSMAVDPVSLETNHVHLAVPVDLWEAKYSKLSRDRILPELLQERALVAVYHTAELLSEAGAQTIEGAPAPTGRQEKRHIFGFYDGRAIAILPYQTRQSRFTLPPQYRSVAWLFFLPHRSGELAVSAGERHVAFDLSFDANLADWDTWHEELVRFDDSGR